MRLFYFAKLKPIFFDNVHLQFADVWFADASMPKKCFRKLSEQVFFIAMLICGQKKSHGEEGGG